MKKIQCALIGLFLIIASISLQAQDLSENLEQLINWMTGEFDSSEQAQANEEFYNISLKMTRIWPERPNGVWLYVEQAVAETPDKPYRQRIYFVSELAEDEYSSDVYTLPDPEKYIGAWRNPEMLDKLTPFDIVNKSGCAVILFYDGFQYAGATAKGTCKSDMNGASYATSEVIILPDEIGTLDRGFDADGNHVWGSESGAYIFKRRN